MLRVQWKTLLINLKLLNFGILILLISCERDQKGFDLQNCDKSKRYIHNLYKNRKIDKIFEFSENCHRYEMSYDIVRNLILKYPIEMYEIIKKGNLDLNINSSRGENLFFILPYLVAKEDEFIELIFSRLDFNNKSDVSGLNPLMLFCGELEHISYLKFIKPKELSNVFSNGAFGNNALHDCASMGNLRLLKLIISAYINDHKIFLKNKSGLDILQLAILNKKYDVVDYLLSLDLRWIDQNPPWKELIKSSSDPKLIKFLRKK